MFLKGEGDSQFKMWITNSRDSSGALFLRIGMKGLVYKKHLESISVS